MTNGTGISGKLNRKTGSIFDPPGGFNFWTARSKKYQNLVSRNQKRDRNPGSKTDPENGADFWFGLAQKLSPTAVFVTPTCKPMTTMQILPTRQLTLEASSLSGRPSPTGILRSWPPHRLRKRRTHLWIDFLGMSWSSSLLHSGRYLSRISCAEGAKPFFEVLLSYPSRDFPFLIELFCLYQATYIQRTVIIHQAPCVLVAHCQVSIHN